MPSIKGYLIEENTNGSELVREIELKLTPSSLTQILFNPGSSQAINSPTDWIIRQESGTYFYRYTDNKLYRIAWLPEERQFIYQGINLRNGIPYFLVETEKQILWDLNMGELKTKLIQAQHLTFPLTASNPNDTNDIIKIAFENLKANTTVTNPPPPFGLIEAYLHFALESVSETAGNNLRALCLTLKAVLANNLKSFQREIPDVLYVEANNLLAFLDPNNLHKLIKHGALFNTKMLYELCVGWIKEILKLHNQNTEDLKVAQLNERSPTPDRESEDRYYSGINFYDTGDLRRIQSLDSLHYGILNAEFYLLNESAGYNQNRIYLTFQNFIKKVEQSRLSKTIFSIFNEYHQPLLKNLKPLDIQNFLTQEPWSRLFLKKQSSYYSFLEEPSQFMKVALLVAERINPDEINANLKEILEIFPQDHNFPPNQPRTRLVQRCLTKISPDKIVDIIQLLAENNRQSILEQHQQLHAPRLSSCLATFQP